MEMAMFAGLERKVKAMPPSSREDC